ncbi:alpha/beta fold hydrolase [Calidifontibacter terrae]
MSPDSSLPQLAEPWGAAYRVVDLGGEVAYLDFGAAADGNGDGTPYLFVHGLGGCALNWALIGQQLRTGRRAYAVDLAGHGLTRAIERSSAVRANVDLVRRFIQEVVGEPVVLVGNSMGGLISAMVADQHPDLVRAMVLLDPAMPVPRRHPGRQISAFRTLLTPAVRGGVARARKRPISAQAEVETVLQICFADWTRHNQPLTDAHVDLAQLRRAFPEAVRSLAVAARTMVRELLVHERVMARYRRITAPVLLINGAQDRLVPVEAARWAALGNPGWTYLEWADTGHVPMLEHPERTVAAIRDWLNAAEVAA